jgi:sigma-B regulation protein RsbU (phosphoserine phosphatase)
MAPTPEQLALYDGGLCPVQTFRAGRKRRCQRVNTRKYRKAYEELLLQVRLAASVQASLLPRRLPLVPGVSLARGYLPANHMSGDFYTAFRLDADHLGLVVGDVMGHGPGASLLTVYALQSIQTKRIDGSTYSIVPPAEVLAQLSQLILRADLPTQPFLTMVYAVLNARSRRLVYSSGGHPVPAILSAGRAPRWLKPNSPLLGVIEAGFYQDELTLEPGDRLVLYTDGAADAAWGGRGHGLDALFQWLDPSVGPAALQPELDAALGQVSFERGRQDDLTLLVADITAA